MLIDTDQHDHNWYSELHSYYQCSANGIIAVDTALGLPSAYQIYSWYGRPTHVARKFEPGQPIALEIEPILNAGRKHVCL